MKCGSPEERAVLQWIVSRAKIVVGARKVILFGSRARSDADDRSDFDIAIEPQFPDAMSQLRSEVEENPLTLLAFDIININLAEETFRTRILSEGRDITTISDL
jgi:predicted nucleotidyltransferase